MKVEAISTNYQNPKSQSNMSMQAKIAREIERNNINEIAKYYNILKNYKSQDRLSEDLYNYIQDTLNPYLVSIGMLPL